MRDLRIKEPMTKAEKREHGEEHRIEYVYGAVCEYDSRTPIILKSTDFWMPISRAKRIHERLGRAIAECEGAKRKGGKR